MSVWQLPCIRREATPTSLFSEKKRRSPKAFFLVSTSKWFRMSQDLLKANVELEVFAHFQAEILALSSLFPLKFERLFIIKRFGSFMIHWAGYPAKI